MSFREWFKKIYTNDLSFNELELIARHLENLEAIHSYDPLKDNSLEQEVRFIKIAVGSGSLSTIVNNPKNKGKSLKSIIKSGKITPEQVNRIKK